MRAWPMISARTRMQVLRKQGKGSISLAKHEAELAALTQAMEQEDARRILEIQAGVIRVIAQVRVQLIGHL